MRPDTEFLTPTMARVYADQGHYEKAVEIYRHLLSLSPDRRDVADALAEAEKSLAGNRPSGQDRLVSLVVCWLDLAAGREKIIRLEELAREIAIHRGPHS